MNFFRKSLDAATTAIKEATEVPEMTAKGSASTPVISDLGEAETDKTKRQGKLYALTRADGGVSLVHHCALVLHYEEKDFWLVIEGGVTKTSSELILNYTKSDSRPEGELSEFNSAISLLFDVVDIIPSTITKMLPTNPLFPIKSVAKEVLPYIEYLNISPAQFQNVARNLLDNHNKDSNDSQPWAKEAASELSKYKE